MSERMQKKECQTECRRSVRKNVRKNAEDLSERMSEYEDHSKKVRVTESSAGNKRYVSQPSPSQLMCASVAASLLLRMCHFRFRTFKEGTDISKIKYIRHRL